jgi:CHAT domain-containing protein
LQTARGIYRCGPEAVCKNVQTFYFELVDLLLQQTSHEGTTPGEYQLLEDVIENIESFRSAELRNVLDCPKQSLETLENLWRQLPESTVVLYPIVLDDRLELLLVSRSGIQRFPVAVKQEELRKEVDKQLDNIGNFRSLVIDGYRHGKRNHELPPVDKLYQWLIKPIERTLEKQEIDTIVMVPFGNLTRLPFAALYDDDDKRYIVEKYALAVIPGLRLTDFTWPPQSELIRALLVGASTFKLPSLKAKRELDDNMEMVLPELPPVLLPPVLYVSHELDNIGKILKDRGNVEILNVEILKEEEFTVSELEATLKKTSYSIIHFSGYGFSDSQGETFLQTYDAPLSMNELWELIKTQNVGQPLDLLTLSASRTALKGERSSLELMGVALKTEARSVLASLWNVNDEATAKLMIEFYRQWQQNGFSNKAKALQQAQLELLKTPGFEHPYYWASFVLIGNWQ